MSIVVGVVDTAVVVVVYVDEDLVGIDNWSDWIDDHKLEDEMGYRVVKNGKDIGFGEMNNPLEELLLVDGLFNWFLEL